MCKSKIHHATVTGADPNYVGSIGVDRTLMRLTDIVDGEQACVWNVNNGERIETSSIELPEGCGGKRLSDGRHHRAQFLARIQSRMR
jgi:aspartate 1-decarboxylase